MTHFYTDYPFIELDDTAGEEAPIRACTVLAYDGDKYCTVRVEGQRLSLKAGYIYTQPGRCGEVPAFDPTPFGPVPVNAAEYAALKEIAYCAGGMFEAEAQDNNGEAREWKRQLKLKHDHYDDLKYG